MRIKAKTMISGCTALIAAGCGLSLTGVQLVVIAKEFNLSISQSATVLTANYAGYLLMVVMGGILTERFGKKPVLCLANAICVASSLTMAFSKEIITLYAAVFMIAGSSGMIESIASSLMADIDKTRATYFANVSFGTMTAGYLLGTVCAGVVERYVCHWSMSYLVVTVFSFLSLTVILPEISRPKQYRGTPSTGERRHMVCNVVFIVGCVCTFCYTGIEVTIFSWLTTFFVKEGGASYYDSIWIMFMLYASLLAGRLLCDWACKLVPHVKLASIAAFISFFLIAGVLQIKNLALAGLGVCVLGITMSCIFPYLVGTAGKQNGAASAYSIIIACGGLGTVIIPGAVGYLGELLSVRWSIIIMSSCFPVIGILISKIMSKSE